MDTRLYRPTWQKVSALCKGQVYMEVRDTVIHQLKDNVTRWERYGWISEEGHLLHEMQRMAGIEQDLEAVMVHIPVPVCMESR